MKNYRVEARTNNGIRLVTEVMAENATEAELSAGRHMMELGVKGDSVKIHSVEEK